MGQWDFKNNHLHKPAIRPQTATSTVTGSGVDMRDTTPCFAELVVGTVSGTSPTLDVKLQESDTSGGTYSDISGATFAQVTASNKEEIINFKRTKRFVRALATIAGTSPSFAFAVNVFGRKDIT